VFDFFEGATASLQAEIIGKVDITHAALADTLTNAITAAQYFSIFQRDWHICPIRSERLYSAMLVDVSALLTSTAQLILSAHIISAFYLLVV
jgi:hypothetical protein